LILRKIIKFVATRCHRLELLCINFHFGWNSAQAPFKELTSGLKGPSIRRGAGKEGKERKGEGRERPYVTIE